MASLVSQHSTGNGWAILNTRAQATIQRIGGIREGVVRRHPRRADDTWRDSVYYSTLVTEWPAAKQLSVPAVDVRRTEADTDSAR